MFNIYACTTELLQMIVHYYVCYNDYAQKSRQLLLVTGTLQLIDTCV
jgi:hypothetical protein